MKKGLVVLLFVFMVIVSNFLVVGNLKVDYGSEKNYDGSYGNVHKVMLDETPDTNIPDIILDDEFYQNAERDRVQYENVELNGDILTLTFGYSGGCLEHDFALVGPTTFMESEPVQTTIVLSHDDYDDPCDAWLYETLSYDLSPLKELWQEYYQQSSGTIIIWLEEYEDAIIYEF